METGKAIIIGRENFVALVTKLGIAQAYRAMTVSRKRAGFVG